MDKLVTSTVFKCQLPKQPLIFLRNQNNIMIWFHYIFSSISSSSCRDYYRYYCQKSVNRNKPTDVPVHCMTLRDSVRLREKAFTEHRSTSASWSSASGDSAKNAHRKKSDWQAFSRQAQSVQYTYFNYQKGEGFDLNSLPLEVGGALANDINSLALRKVTSKENISNNLRRNMIVIDSKKMNESGMHIVFSTDCSFYQDWQTLLVFHSGSVIKQPGKITRIASGCDAVKQDQLKKLYTALYPHGNCNVHFTPDFKIDEKTNKKYDFYNKPYGMEHWLDHSDPPIKDGSIIALIDPDMILLRNITHKIRGETNNIFIASTKHKLKAANNNEDGIVPIEVKKGQAAAQLYQLGAPWATANKNFNRTNVCGIDSPCMKVTREFGEEFFSVGPPYILEKSDMLKLTKAWVKMVPLVYERYPNLLAEMYAYSMAAAHAEIPHFTVTHYMVSNTDVSDEGWKWIDAFQQNVCERPDESGIYYPGKNLPTVMHYCQFFRAGENGFQKRRVNKNMFECDPKSPLLADPPDDLAKVDYKNRDGEIIKLGPIAVRRNSFALCVISRSINSMIIDYKYKMCKNTPNNSINRNVTINLANLKY